MAYRVAINGFGRIGRQVFKAVHEGGFDDLYEVVAINDTLDTKGLAHLLKYDSTYGPFDAEIKATSKTLKVNGREIKTMTQRSPSDLPWDDLEIDLVIESTGKFTNAADADQHIDAGASKVIITGPAKGEDITIVLGVNEGDYDPDTDDIISNASCTTNCLAPVAKVILDEFGIKHGLMTTIHSYTNDQVILDGTHKDLRRARSAAQNIIPTTTGAAKALAAVIPELKGKFDGFSVRVPTATVSLIDFVVETESPVTVRKVNDAFKKAAQSEEMAGIIGYSDEPLVSSDYRHDPRSAIIDGLSTMVIGETMLKVVAWYDNEWAYSCRVAELAALVCEHGFDIGDDDEEDDEDDIDEGDDEEGDEGEE